MKEFNYTEIESATNFFSINNLLGKGSHGSVYKGTLNTGKPIAVKKPSLGLASKLDAEIAILSSINSPNIVNLLGVTISPSHHKLLIMELMPRGSLHDLLHSSATPPTWPHRAAAAFQLTRAVAALHAAAPPVVHRDIKPANVLFDQRGNARLADFSLGVRISGSESQSDLLPAGTIGYLDPSYTTPDKLGMENDVYSIGVVLLELVSGRQAVDAEWEPAGVVAWAVPLVAAGKGAEVSDRRVMVPVEMEGAVNRILGVACKCVSHQRPKITEVVAELTGVVEEIRWCRRRRMLTKGVFGCVTGWRRRAAGRVTAMKIVCKDGDSRDEQEMASGLDVVRGQEMASGLDVVRGCNVIQSVALGAFSCCRLDYN